MLLTVALLQQEVQKFYSTEKMNSMDINKAFSIVTTKLQGWMDSLIAILPNLLVAVFVLLAFFLLARLTRKLIGSLLARLSTHETINRLVVNTTGLVVHIVGLFIALEVLNLDKTVTSLLAGAGILGLALGIAFQDIVANFVSGIILAIRQPFRVGDIIESNGHFGTVAAITLRTTNVLSFDGQMVWIPNQQIFKNPITNYTQTGARRVELSVGVSYGDNLEHVQRITTDAIKTMQGLHPEREVELYFKEFGDSSIVFDVYFWIQFAQQREYLQARSTAIMRVKAAYNANGIAIPFPIRTLDFGIKGGEKLADVPLRLARTDESNKKG